MSRLFTLLIIATVMNTAVANHHFSGDPEAFQSFKSLFNDGSLPYTSKGNFSETKRIPSNLCKKILNQQSGQTFEAADFLKRNSEVGIYILSSNKGETYLYTINSQGDQISQLVIQTNHSSSLHISSNFRININSFVKNKGKVNKKIKTYTITNAGLIKEEQESMKQMGPISDF